MKKADFEELNEPQWRELEDTLAALDKRQPTATASNLPKLFRQACGDLALAQHRMYGKRLCDRLNDLVIGAYQRLQLAAVRGGGAFLSLFTTKFPQAVRKEAGLVSLSLALFFVPFLAFILAAYFDPKWIYALLSPEARHQMDQMYGSDQPGDFFRERFGSDFSMFGFYIMNNVSIHFRIFAGGVLLVVGAAWAIGYQGIFLGATFGYVHHTGNLHRLYTFCASHSSFELLGFILGGAAGMRLGMALVAPGRLTRLAAMREAGKRALPILCGSTAMLVVAAMIEAFWSASYMAAEIKYAVGISGWLLFAAYFCFAGRRAHAA